MTYKYAISTCVEASVHSVLLTNSEPSNVFGPNDLFLTGATISIDGGVMSLKGTVIPLIRIHRGPIGSMLHITEDVYGELLRQLEPQFVTKYVVRYRRKKFLRRAVDMVSLPVAMYPMFIEDVSKLPHIQLISTSFSVIDMAGGNIKGTEW